MERKPLSLPTRSMIAVTVLALVTTAGIAMAAGTPSTSIAAAGKGSEAKPVTTSSGLKYVELEPGTGAVVKSGMRVLVDYEGWLPDGTKFDSSLDRREPYAFKVGAGEVIQGWEEGVVGMKVGGKRKLIVPPALAYGDAGAGGGRIPPNATLTFELKLLTAQ